MNYFKITPQMLLGFSGESSSSGSCEGKQARKYLKNISFRTIFNEPNILSAQKMNETIKRLEEFEKQSSIHPITKINEQQKA